MITLKTKKYTVTMTGRVSKLDFKIILESVAIEIELKREGSFSYSPEIIVTYKAN